MIKKIFILLYVLLSLNVYGEEIIEVQENIIAQKTVESSVRNFQELIKKYENTEIDIIYTLDQINSDIDFYFNIERISRNFTKRFWNIMDEEEQKSFQDNIRKSFRYYLTSLSRFEEKPQINILRTEILQEHRAKVYTNVIFENNSHCLFNIVLVKQNNFWFITDFEIDGVLLSNFVYNNIKPYLNKKDFDLMYDKIFNIEDDNRSGYYIMKSLINRMFNN